MKRRLPKGQPRFTQTITLGGLTFTNVVTPFCDCPTYTMGFVKRADGVWVKPCCQRVTEHVWLKHGERPSTGLKDCPGCQSNDHRSDAPWRQQGATA